MSIKELPSMERPYEKFETYGSDKLSDAELLAIIIKAGTKDKTSVQLIQELMNEYDYENKGISFLNELSLTEIQRIKGLGKIKSIQLKAICEISKRSTKPANLTKFKIASPEDAAKLVMEDLRYLAQERLVSILLDSQCMVLKIITITIGGLNKNLIEPREIFKEPIKLSADKIILAHNHPSGNPFPSDNDIKMTRRMAEAGKIFGIEILDHVIIGNGIFSSLKKMNKF